VGLASGDEFRLDANMELAIADREPNATSLAQRHGLLHLTQSNEIAEEATGLGLASGRRSNLNMIE
jgi:hypothetical protein